MPIKPHPLKSLAKSINKSHKPIRPKSPTEKSELKRPLDGEGKPYITLAQLLKASDLAETGGSAKHRVRDGGITVNGIEEQRPGRKLHTGDIVLADGKKITVSV